MSLTCHLPSFASQDADVPGKALSRGQRISPRRASHLHVPAPQRAWADRQPGAVRRPRAGRNARPVPRPPPHHFSAQAPRPRFHRLACPVRRRPGSTAAPSRRPLVQCAGATTLVGGVPGLGSAGRPRSGPCDLRRLDPISYSPPSLTRPPASE